MATKAELQRKAYLRAYYLANRKYLRSLKTKWAQKSRKEATHVYIRIGAYFYPNGRLELVQNKAVPFHCTCCSKKSPTKKLRRKK